MIEDEAKKKLHEELDLWLNTMESVKGEHRFVLTFKLDDVNFNMGIVKVFTEEVVPGFSYVLTQK